MKTVATALIVLAFIALSASAETDAPSLPRVPRGFDEGRTAFVLETADGMIQPGVLVERLFEEADLVELAGFIHLHMLSDEKRALDESLKLGGLMKCNDQASALALLRVRTPAEVAEAIGAMLVSRKYSLSDVGAWLYARGFNFNVLQRALNGERLDAMRLRRQLIAIKDPKAASLVTPGIWEFNLDDSREEKGGTYSGVQLVEALIALGWDAADFAKVAGVKALPAWCIKLMEWGDPRIAWGVLEAYCSESELIERVVKHYRQNDDPAVLQVALVRANTTMRWFRTGGPGVSGVYRGPWPGGKDSVAPPTSRALAIGDVDAAQFAAALDQPLIDHFSQQGDYISLVTYDDGSARAFLDKPKREPIEYAADTPFGAIVSTRQAYEGRVSISGRNGLLYLVFANEQKAAPPEFELANVKLAAGGAFFTADIDDGINLTPMLLRRVSRLVE